MLDQKVSREEIEQAKIEANTKYYHTTFEHLDAHNGIRKGVYTVYMGTPSCGKSGISKAIALQSSTTSKDTRVLMILTEESKATYAMGLQAYADQCGMSLANITFFEESSMEHENLRTHDRYLDALREVIVGSFAELVIIDNITSGRLYGPQSSIFDQGKTVWWLKNLTKDLNLAVVVICHTDSKVTDNMGRLFTTQDHFGSKALGKEAGYFHAMQKFTSGDHTYVFTRGLKHRFHPHGGGTYLLRYDKELGVYVGDNKVPFEKMVEIFQMRDKLGK